MMSRIIAVVSVLALAFSMYPATAAQGPADSIVIGVIGDGIEGDGAPGVTVDRIHPRDLAPGRAGGTDALLLDAGAFKDVTKDGDRRGVLAAYAKQGKPIFVKDGDMGALNDLVDGPIAAYESVATEGIHFLNAPVTGPLDVDVSTNYERFTGLKLHKDRGATKPVYLDMLVLGDDGTDVSHVAGWVTMPGITGAPDAGTTSTASTSSVDASWGSVANIKACVNSNTYGDICTVDDIDFQYDDGTPQYDFWANMQRVTTYPGIGYYGTQWRTHMQLLYSDADGSKASQELIDYAAPSQDHVDVVTTNVGTTAGKYGAVYTVRTEMGYGLDEAALTQASSMADDYAYVYHTIDQGTGTSDSSYSTYPGYVVRGWDGQNYDNSFIYRGYWKHAGTGDVVYTGGYITYSLKAPQ